MYLNLKFDAQPEIKLMKYLFPQYLIIIHIILINPIHFLIWGFEFEYVDIWFLLWSNYAVLFHDKHAVFFFSW